VYIIFYDHQFDYETYVYQVEKVFTTKEKAQGFIDDQPKKYRDRYEIVERILE